MLVWLIPVLISFLILWILMVVSDKVGLSSGTSEERWINKEVPRIAGIIIFLSSYFILFTKYKIDLVFILFWSGIFLVGLIDDLYELKPSKKFLGQLICVFLFYFYAQGLSWPAGAFLGCFFILFMVNSFNLIDNMDGACMGVSLIIAISLFALSREMYLLFLILALLIPFAFNLKGKIYLGDSGAMFLGAVLSVLALGIIKNWFVLILFFLFPLIDTVFVSVLRTIKGRPFWVGGTDHISHKLASILGSEKIALIDILIFCSISVLLGGLICAF